MTWSSASSLALETSTRALDRPVLVGSHVYDPSVMRPLWSNGSGLSSDTDISGQGPAYYAVDRSKYRQTNPDDTNTSFYLVFAWSGTFDTFAFLNTTLQSVSGISVSIQIANDGAFSSALTTIATGIAPTSSEYLGFMSTVYSGSGYVRVRFTAPAGFTPYIGEFWLGRRRQLRAGLADHHDPDARASTAFVQDDGSTASVKALATGRREPEIMIHTNDRDATLLDQSTLRSWWSDIGYGSRSFIWCPNPATAQDTAYLCRTNAKDLDLPKIGPVGGRDFEQQFQELPPYLGLV